MNTMKIFGLSLVSAIALAGCGGSGGANAQNQTPYSPYQTNGQYNQPGVQPYICQAGTIQLRNPLGKTQCFPTANLAEACSQLGGSMTANAQCRKERQIQGTAKGRFRNNGQMAPDNIPLHVNLFSGEAVKVYGKIDSLNGDVVNWNAQLIQGGMVLGYAYGDSIRSSEISNVSITSTSTANSVQQNYVNPSVYQNPYQPTTYPNPNGLYTQGFYGQPAQATPNLLIFQVMFEGKIKVELHATAISCEDGKGNSYPCQ